MAKTWKQVLEDKLGELGDRVRDWLSSLGADLGPQPQPVPVPVSGRPRR